MTKDALPALLLEWQQRLRVQDWRIELSVVRTSAFGDTKTLGECDPLRCKKFATLKILDPIDRDGRDDVHDDLEVVLVHELLHLVFLHHDLGLTCDPDDSKYRHYERGIDITARALVAAKRGQASQ